MKNTLKKISLFSLLSVLLIPSLALAHQPRIVESRQTIVPEPEISKAYYGHLTGEPDVYVIHAEKPFDLYVNILVPDIAGQERDVTVMIHRGPIADESGHIGMLDSPADEWKQFYEPFGADAYWMGPAYKSHVEAGEYTIEVSSPNNDRKYSLAIGEIEAFNFKESMNALTLIPKLKKNFFEESPISFIKSPFGWGLIVVMYLLATIVGLLYRFILKRLAKGTVRGVSKNIGKNDRLLRLAIGVGLLLWAITTTWSPIIIFFSGFAIFEAAFSWCGLYAAIGKNTCPVN